MELQKIVATKNRWFIVGKFSLLFIAAAYFFPILTVFLDLSKVFEEYFVAALGLIGVVSFCTLVCSAYYIHQVFERMFKRERVFGEIRKATPHLLRKLFELESDGADVLEVILECEEFDLLSEYAAALEARNRKARKLAGTLPDTEEGRRQKAVCWRKSERIEELPTWKYKEQEVLARRSSRLPLDLLQVFDQHDIESTLAEETSAKGGDTVQVT